MRSLHRRRRLHRVVDGDHRQGARPVARRRADRRPRDRLGGQRSQRRVHGVEPDPRRRQRSGALPAGTSAARRARSAEPQRDRSRDQAIQHRLRLRTPRGDRRRHGLPSSELPRRVARRLPAAPGAGSEGRVAGRVGDALAGQLGRRTPAGCGARTAPPSSIPHGSCGG